MTAIRCTTLCAGRPVQGVRPRARGTCVLVCASTTTMRGVADGRRWWWWWWWWLGRAAAVLIAPRCEQLPTLCAQANMRGAAMPPLHGRVLAWFSLDSRSLLCAAHVSDTRRACGARSPGCRGCRVQQQPDRSVVLVDGRCGKQQRWRHSGTPTSRNNLTRVKRQPRVVWALPGPCSLITQMITQTRVARMPRHGQTTRCFDGFFCGEAQSVQHPCTPPCSKMAQRGSRAVFGQPT